MNTPAIIAAMRERYKAPEYALMFEVGNATGHGTRRHADAVAMSLWPSRGLEIIGFEFKASRSDWLRELKNPAKAEEIAAYCDRWFVVTLADVVKPGEMPIGWGHLELKAGTRAQLELAGGDPGANVFTLRQVKDAPRREEVKPISRSFVGAMLRRASEADEQVLHAAVYKATETIRREAVAHAKRDNAHALRELEELKKVVQNFETASGFSIGSRYGGDSAAIGAAVKLVQKIGPRAVYGMTERVARDAEQLSKAIAELGAALDPPTELKEAA